MPGTMPGNTPDIELDTTYIVPSVTPVSITSPLQSRSQSDPKDTKTKLQNLPTTWKFPQHTPVDRYQHRNPKNRALIVRPLMCIYEVSFVFDQTSGVLMFVSHNFGQYKYKLGNSTSYCNLNQSFHRCICSNQC